MTASAGVPWLTVLALLPTLGAVVVLLGSSRAAKLVALATSLVTVVLAVVLTVGLRSGGGLQLSEDVVWIGPLGAHYALGLDGIGATLVLLASIVTPVVVLATWGDYDREPLATGQHRPAGEPARYDSKIFYALVLAVQTGLHWLDPALAGFLQRVAAETVRDYLGR